MTTALPARVAHLNRRAIMLLNLALCLLASNAVHAADTATLLREFPRSSVTIMTPDARQHEFDVWVADTPAHSEQGLMGVTELPAQSGMLFVFARPQPIAMWMKNTPLPLDMLFINAEGRVTHLIHNATPLSQKTLPSRGPVLGVLELPGGSAKALNIAVGAMVKHPAFGAQRQWH